MFSCGATSSVFLPICRAFDGPAPASSTEQVLCLEAGTGIALLQQFLTSLYITILFPSSNPLLLLPFHLLSDSFKRRIERNPTFQDTAGLANAQEMSFCGFRIGNNSRFMVCRNKTCSFKEQ